MNLIWRSSRQETGPKIGRTGEGTVEGIKIALIPLFIRSRIDGLNLFGQFRGRGELVNGDSAASPEEDKTGHNERKDSTDQVHCSIKDRPRHDEFRIHLRFEGGP
ncbi:MAG: hypothetical protein JNM92_15375 [Zoogloea sp.]|nr:hypothetical protein [Zoogloea sp.]